MYIFIRLFKSLILLLVTCHCALTAYAERWEEHASEAEVQSLIYQLLEDAELDLDAVDQGSYPLIGPQYSSRAVLPLLSSPCPLLLGCDALIQRLRNELLNRGYRFVYSASSPRVGGPRHYAIARGKKPVMALRLFETSSIVSLVLHLDPGAINRESDLEALPAHVTLTLGEEELSQLPQLATWLDHREREYFIRIDDLLIKRALIDPETGERVMHAHERRSRLRDRLNKLYDRAPAALGLYLDLNATQAVDRALIDEIIQHSQHEHRVLILPDQASPLLSAAALTNGVRQFTLSQELDLRSDRGTQLLSRTLSSLEATLVLDGGASLGLRLASAEHLTVIKKWLSRVAQRKVSLLRLSERAY